MREFEEDEMPDQVEREIELAVDAERAWEALTEAGWLGEKVELQLEPGGEATFVVDGERREGWVEEVRAPERLTFWWAPDDAPASRVELELVPVGEGRTRLRVRETRPLEILDLVGIPLPGQAGPRFGPALVAA